MTSNDSSSRFSRSTLTIGWLFVAIVACALALYRIDRCGLQHWDEGAYTAGPLKIGPYERADIVPFYAPPLYPAWVALCFDIFGKSETIALLSSGILGLLALVPFALLISALFGATRALVASLFLATTEYYLAYCRMALTDAPYLLFFLLALYLLHQAIERRRRWLFVIGGLASGLALLTKYHGFLPVAMAGLFMLLQTLHAFIRCGRREGWKHARDLVANTALMIFGFIGPVAFLVLHIKNTVGFEAYLENRTQWMPGLAPWAFRASAAFIARSFWEWTSPLLLVLGLVGAMKSLRSFHRGVGYFLCWAIPFLVAVPFYKNYPRLLLPLVPALAVLASVGINALLDVLRPQKNRALSLLVVAVIVSACSAWKAFDTLSILPSGYRKAASVIREEMTEGKTALLLSQHNIFFYLDGAPGTYLSHNEDLGKETLRSGTFDLLAVDLRVEHAPEFEEFLEGPQALTLLQLATIDNPMFEMTVVNTGGFDLLDAIRSDPLSQRAREAKSIAIYTHRQP